MATDKRKEKKKITETAKYKFILTNKSLNLKSKSDK